MKSERRNTKKGVAEFLISSRSTMKSNHASTNIRRGTGDGAKIYFITKRCSEINMGKKWRFEK